MMLVPMCRGSLFQLGILLASVLMCVWSTSVSLPLDPAAGVKVLLPQSLRLRIGAGSAIEHPISVAKRRLEDIVVLHSAGSPGEHMAMIVVTVFISDYALGEAYTITHDGHASINVTATGPRGAMYALHHLSDSLQHCKLSFPMALKDQCLPAEIVETPVFAMRHWSEQGQLLDFPERSYWSDSAPYANISRVQDDIDELLALVPILQRLRINALSWEFSMVEDFINWDYLPVRSGGTIYPNDPSDHHRQRVTAFTETIDKFLQQLHYNLLDSYMMFIEFGHPEKLAAEFDITSVYSSDLALVIRARFKELFERLPHLTGVIIYCSDSWSPRAGYSFRQLWQTPDEFAHLGSLYYDAVVTQLGKKLVFDLWVPATPLPGNAWEFFNKTLPTNITISINDGQGDYVYANPTNTLLQQGAGRDRRTMVSCDLFRQYDGWGRTISFPGTQWEQRLRLAANTQVQGVALYGSWSPSNTWPDTGPELINNTQPSNFKLWLGKWNDFRIFTNNADSPMQGNAYVLAQLAWNPFRLDSEGLVAEWAQLPPLSLTVERARLVARAFAMSPAAWSEMYLENVDEYAIAWTMVFTPKYAPNAESTGNGLLSLFSNATLAQIRQSNAKGRSAAASVVDLIHTAMNVSSFVNPAGYNLVRAAELSYAYLDLYFNFREAVYLNHTLAGPQLSPTLCADLEALLPLMRSALNEMWEKYPREATAWQLSRPDPNLDVRPDFFRLHERSMADWLPLFAMNLQRRCPAVV